MRTDQFVLFAINLAYAAWQWGGELEMCRICHVLPLNTSSEAVQFPGFLCEWCSSWEGSCRSHPPKSLFSGTLL